jgi:hypothetical protein
MSSLAVEDHYVQGGAAGAPGILQLLSEEWAARRNPTDDRPRKSRFTGL